MEHTDKKMSPEQSLFGSLAPQQLQQQQYNQEEDNLSAQRAAIEALHIGRATLSQTHQQGEQLRNAESYADDTQYTLDKAGRILRGMTWSGWVANLFTSDIQHPQQQRSSDTNKDGTTAIGGHQHRQPPLVYEGLPESCHMAAQAIQNYHANLLVLPHCESGEQRETCQLICNNMYDISQQQLKLLEYNTDVQAYHQELQQDLNILREKQQQHSTKQPLMIPAVSSTGSSGPAMNGSTVTRAVVSVASSPPSTPASVLHDQQEQHLQILSSHLEELGSIALSLQDAMHQQTSTLERLDSKSDDIVEQTQRVTRRADRLVHHNNASWFFPSTSRPILKHAQIVIRHVDTGLYLSILKGDSFLLPKFQHHSCTFALYQRPNTQLLGIQHVQSRRYLGQSALLGGLQCTSPTMGRREEWQIDGTELQGAAEDAGDETDGTGGWSNATLLCASASWGAGGYVMVRSSKDYALVLGGSNAEDKRKAARFHIQTSTR